MGFSTSNLSQNIEKLKRGNFYFWKILAMPKKTEMGDSLGFPTSILSQTIKKLKGDRLETFKFFRKKYHNAKKLKAILRNTKRKYIKQWKNSNTQGTDTTRKNPNSSRNKLTGPDTEKITKTTARQTGRNKNEKHSKKRKHVKSYIEAVQF